MNIASEPSGLRGHCSFGPVPIQLDAVLVGIAQIERFADAVIAGAVERNAGLDHAMQRVRQRGAGRIKNRGVKQPRRSRRRRMAAFAFPGVQADVVVIAAGRNERRAGAQALHQFEAEHAAIKSQRAIEIGDLEMNMPDPRSRDDGRGFSGMVCSVGGRCVVYDLCSGRYLTPARKPLPPADRTRTCSASSTPWCNSRTAR